MPGTHKTEGNEINIVFAVNEFILNFTQQKFPFFFAKLEILETENVGLL
jgi:hypothetical protein